MQYVNPKIDSNEALQNEYRKIIRKKQFRTRVLSCFIVCVLIAVTFAITWIYGNQHGKKSAEAENQELAARIAQLESENQELRNTPLVVTSVTPQINLDLVHNEIKEIGELATVEYLFTNAAKYSDFKQINNWNIPFTEKSFIQRWNGVIKAGVRLDEAVITVDEEKKALNVLLPQAEILSYETDTDNIEIIDEQNNIFNIISVDDKVAFDASTKKEMIERAVNNGLLEKAQKNAEDIITRLLTANPAIGTDYTIVFAVAE